MIYATITKKNYITLYQFPPKLSVATGVMKRFTTGVMTWVSQSVLLGVIYMKTTVFSSSSLIYFQTLNKKIFCNQRAKKMTLRFLLSLNQTFLAEN